MRKDMRMTKIKKAIHRARPGEPVLLSDLRKQSHLSKAVFDATIIDLANSGWYFLSHESRPPGSLTDAERAAMVPAGDGRFFDTISVREDAETAEPLQIELPTKTIDKGGTTQSVVVPPIHHIQAKPPKRGRGRPPIQAHMKRVVSSGSFRLPAWLFDWLKAEGDMGHKIETALIERYKLTPPRGDDGK